MTSLGWTAATALSAGLAALSVSSPVHTERRAEHTGHHATKKGGTLGETLPLLGTLVDIHSGERFPLDAENPHADALDNLLRDRVTGAREHLDPRLFELLRALAEKNPGARFELVSGYRSPKLNEMLRKKGHHVASHSQHSLGHAVDFRVVPPETPEEGIGPPAEREPVDPLVLEGEIRSLGWTGGTGVYLSATDRFVHADVGPNRRWNGL
jgi:uncharacterized protein YcbK (DUF882 family)